MKKPIYLFTIFYTLMFRYDCIAQTVTDIDGNVYHTVIIGSQVWMKENLKVIHFANGDTIYNGVNNASWTNLSSPAYCNFQNDTVNGTAYGRLYNWYAMKDSRGLCPQGWIIPNDSDWDMLVTELGGISIAGKKMKSVGHGWMDGGGNDSSKFSGLPGGYRWGKTGTTEGEFNALGDVGAFWSSSDTTPTEGIWWYISTSLGDGIGKTSRHKSYGFSVRCILANATSGMEKEPAMEMFSLYPNPTMGKFTFRNKRAMDSEVQVFDMKGKMVDYFITRGQGEVVLDYPELNNGIYLMHIRNQQGQVIIKFIISK